MKAVCEKCIKDKAIINSVVPMPDRPVCIICGQRSDLGIDIDERKNAELFRAVLRYHYDEWEYNEHMGGESIYKLFENNNKIIANLTGDAVDDFCCTVFNGGYECEDIGVSLFSGYDHDGTQLLPLRALSDEDDFFLRGIRDRLLEQNYFDLIPHLISKIEPFSNYFETVCHDLILSRARIGYESRAVKINSWGEYAYLPFTGKKLGPPPPPLAIAGRINRSGVSFLYMASDPETAVMEIRPHPSHLVSVGSFQQVKSCSVANFHKIRINYFCNSDEKLRDYRFLRTIERDLSSPVIPEEMSHYLLSQLVADVLMRLGFGAVAYQSSVNSRATNYCFFDPGSFTFVEGTAKVRKVGSLTYGYENVLSISSIDDDYMEVKK